MTERRTRTAAKVALTAGLISFLVFLRAVAGDFVNFDDPRFVIDNLDIRHLDGNMIVSALTRQFSNDYWAPLTWISFAIDYHFWGLNPAGYHLVNILFHAVNTGLVVLMADRLWNFGKDARVQAAGMDVGHEVSIINCQEVLDIVNSSSLKRKMIRWIEGESYLYSTMLLLAGLLWGIHPLRVESVAWVAERKDVLYGMLALSSVLCYLRDGEAMRKTGGKGDRRYYLCSLILFLLALMAKPTSVFIPMLLVVADWYPLRRLQKGIILKVLVEKVPFFALSALATMLTVINMSITSAPYSYSQFSFADRVIISGHSIIEFCRLMLFPVGIHLFNTIAPVLAHPMPAYAKTFAVIAFTCYCLYAARRNPRVIAVWLSFLIPLLPTLPFFQVGVDVAYSTRHSYLPSVVPVIAVTAIIAGVYKKITGTEYRYLRYLICFLAATVLIFHVGMTEHLISSWKNSGTLWSRVIKFNPVGRAYNYRALYFMDIGQFSAAADDFLIAAERAVEAGNPEAFNYYALGGDALNRARRYEEAVAAFSTAIMLNPWPNYYYHRGLALQALGRLNEAAEDFRFAGAEKGAIEFQNMW
jgi:protein O-mannosyl-transferase